MNYYEIIESLDSEKVEKLLYELGAESVEDKGEYLITQTICHNEYASEASKKLYYYKNTHNFVCYTEDGTMSIFKFLQHYYETREIAYDWYEDIVKVAQSCSARALNFKVKPYQSRKEKFLPYKMRKELPTFSDKALGIFTKLYPAEWLFDGISKEAMDKYNIRYSIAQQKIIIPHYNVRGELVGIRGRALNPWEVENVGKYMPIQIEQTWYAHPLSLNLYGLNFNKDNIKRYGICYIGESEKFCLQMESFSFPNCSVAVCGSQLNKYHVDLLMRYCAPKEIIVCFDQEETDTTERSYFKKLWNLCYKYKNYCNISFTYDRTGLLKLKESPTDKGQKVFLSLIESRVKVK